MNPEWANRASDVLADIWVEATPDERDQIERAVLRANNELADDPANKGESRAGGLRVLISPPLTLWFRVLPGQRARVVNVRWHGRRP